MRNLVVLISGTGSNLRALLTAIDESRGTADEVGARVVAIGADTERANLALGDEFHIPTFVVKPSDYADRDAWGAALLERIRAYEPDLTILSGFMRLVPSVVVRALSPALVNTHPAYLPEFPGAHAVRDALAASASQTGATIMVVDDGVDTGPVIDQERVAIAAGDTEASLHERIKTIERRLLIETVRGVAQGRIDLTTAGTAANADDGTTPSTATKEPTNS